MDDQHARTTEAAIRPGLIARRPIAFLLLAVLLIAVISLTAWRIATRPSPIHIAFANTVSGPLEQMGGEILTAAALYLDEVNRGGGVDGHPVVLDIVDDKGSAATARDNVQSINDSPALAVIGHFLSAASLAAAPGYQAARIPALTTQALADDVTRDHPYYFRAQTPNSQQAQWLAPYIREVLLAKSGLFPGGASVDLITSADAFGRSFANSFIAAMGQQIPKTWSFNPDDKGLAAAAQDTANALAREAEPRIVVIAASVDISAVFVKAIRRRGIRSMLIVEAAGSDTYLGNFANEPEERAHPGFFTSDLYTTASVVFDTIGVLGQRFAEDYTAKTGLRPSWYSAGANDAMRLMVEALRRAHPANTPQSKAEDREKVRQALASIDSPDQSVPGLDGPLYFDAGRDMSRSLRFATYDHGRLVSTPLQLVQVRHPEFVDLIKGLKSGDILNIGPNFYWIQRVVYTGIDVAHLDDINLRNGTFSADLYVWLRYGGDNSEPTDIEFPDLISGAKTVFDPAKPAEQGEQDGLNYRLYRISGQFKAEFDLHDFPFDTQSLIVRFQNHQQPREQVAYVVDVFGLHLNRPDQSPPGERPAFADLQLWHATDIRYFLHTFSISSTQGKPSVFDNDNRNEYGGFDLAIVVHRDVFAFMVKTLVPLFLLVLVVFAALFFPTSLTKERTTIPVTGILTSAVLLISISNQLPPLGYSIALEYIFYVFFGLCLMAMCSGFLSEILRNKKYHGHAIAIDLIARIAYASVVVVTIGIFLWKYAAW